MSVRMLLGRSGTGKTARCFHEIQQQMEQSEQGAPLIMLVPDQMTFQAEYRLVTETKSRGMTRAQVFSFGRLSLNVLGRTGGITRQKIDSVGINMLLRQIVEQRKADLKVFQRAADQQGFYTVLEEMLTELKRYDYSVDRLHELTQLVTEASGEERKALADKLHDFSLVMNDLEILLAGKYIDSEDTLDMLTEKIPACEFLADAEVWVDGFYAFTPKELAVLGALMKRCRRVTFTMTMDESSIKKTPEETDLFYTPAITYRKLVSLCEQSGVALEMPVLFQDAHRFQHDALAHLERYFGQHPPVSAEESVGVSLAQAENLRSEIEGTAREIVRLVREENYRYRDIAVLVRDMNVYDELMTTIFEDYEIPIFLDQKRMMHHHPLIEFVRSSLEVLQNYWRYEAVFRAVKTDLLISREAAQIKKWREGMDELENYVLAHGIVGKAWTNGKRWTYRRNRGIEMADLTQTDEEKRLENEINELRGMIVDPLQRLQRDFRKAQTARDYCESLYLYMETLEVPLKIEKWRDEAEASGRLTEAREHDQAWSAVIDLLDQMVELIGEETMNLEKFAQLVETGLDSMRFSLVPPALDQVLVGSLDRTRSVDMPCVLIMGANDGVLPAAPAEDGMLSEQEREWLEKQGVELAPPSRLRLSEEEFLVYLALNGAKERLRISYPIADDEGKALQPSRVVNRLHQMFPDVLETLVQTEPDEAADDDACLGFLTSPRRAMVYALGQLRQWKKGYPISPVWWDVYNWFVASEEWRTESDHLIGGLFYENREKPLTGETTRELYGESIQASVSRMERFSSCAFQHFTSYGLRLREREIYRLEAPDIGQLFHSALSMITDHLQQQKKQWSELSNDECGKLADAYVEDVIPKLQHEILLSSNRHHYIARKLKAVVSRAALILRDHAKRSGFAPVGVEIPFGPKAKIPPIRFTLPNGVKMEIVGRIDRVDAANGSEGLLLRVIDYKSSDTYLRLSEVYFGLSLQMLTYLDVVLTYAHEWLGSDALPAGVLYFHVHNPMLQESSDLSADELEKKLFKAFKMKGLLLADEEIARLMDEEMTTGYSDVVPVGLKKNGEFYSQSSVVPAEQFDGVRRYVRQVIEQIGTDITEGEIGIDPFRLKDKTPCKFCSFKPVCQFDPAHESNDYRWLRPEKDEVILKKMLERGSGDDENES